MMRKKPKPDADTPQVIFQHAASTGAMADTKLTDDQVNNLAAVLRNDNTHFDVKVQYVNAIKTGIKQHNIPETCIPQLFDGLRLASSSQHVALATAGFTALNHLFTRMSRQEPKYLAKEAARTLPLVIEKLGDSKDKPRALALQSLNTLYAVAPADVERSIRNTAMVGKNPRAKEASMQWLLEVIHRILYPVEACLGWLGANHKHSLFSLPRPINSTDCRFVALSPCSWSSWRMRTEWSEILLRAPLSNSSSEIHSATPPRIA